MGIAKMIEHSNVYKSLKKMIVYKVLNNAKKYWEKDSDKLKLKQNTKKWNKRECIMKYSYSLKSKIIESKKYDGNE